MTRSAIYVALLTVVFAFTAGWGVGVVTSTRINTVAAKAYAESLDIEARAVYAKQLAESSAAYGEQITGLERARHDDAVAYSEQITGLRAQLVARHVSEPLVCPK